MPNWVVYAHLSIWISSKDLSQIPLKYYKKMSKKEAKSIKFPPSNFNIHPQLMSLPLLPQAKMAKNDFFKKNQPMR